MSEEPLAGQIAGKLRHDILRGTLAPGDPIKERDTAAALDVSRTPMREAIRILAKEGLVVLRPARSPIVADPSLEEVCDLIAVLRALESLSGELACQVASAADIALVRQRHEDLAAMDAHGDRIALFEADMAFHTAIVAAAHNAPLTETHRAYLARLWRVRYLSATRPDKRADRLREHGEMVAALEARDSAALAVTIATHGASMLDNIRAHYAARTRQS